MRNLGMIMLGLSLSSGVIGESLSPESGKGTMGLADLCILTGIPNAQLLSQSEEAVLNLYMNVGVARSQPYNEKNVTDGISQAVVKFCVDPAKATARVKTFILMDIEE